LKHPSKKVTRLALSALSAAVFTLFAGHASALGLGRLSVQSALGDALRAEIDVTSLSAEEASSLQVRIASAETYRAAGVDYHPALAGARVTLARRADGRPYLRLVSERVVTEPFVDLILEMNWASGRLVREYTLLLDPPRNVAQGAAPSAPAQVASPPQAAAAAPNLTASAPAAPAVAAATPVAPVAVAALPPAAAPAVEPALAPAPTPAPRTAEQRAAAVRAQRAASAPAAAKPGDVKVKPGDTLSGIARRVQPDGVSLDQLLVTMFRANPEAFSGDNMNRLRAGAILRVPDAEQAQAVPAGEARSVIVAQSADFNAYRRRLATSVANAPSGSSRQAGGRVEASVDDRKQPATPAPDMLRLSQGAVKASAPEAAISRQAAAKDAKSREAELARNLEDLKKVQGAAVASASGTAAKPPATVTAAAPAPAPAATGGGSTAKSGPGVPIPVTAPPVPAPVVPAPTPTTTPSQTPVVADAAAAASAAAASAAAATMVAAASAPPLPVPETASAASSAMAKASSPSMATAPAPVTPPVTAEAEPAGLMDTILESPYVLPGAGALAVLLAGFGFYRVRQQSKKAASETSFMESRLQPDSFFGQSGGQRVDTTDSAAAAAGAVSSSANYSLSQLDAIGDVDPVAEADVYLAYGRDLQAEEILKEAMRSDPNRLAVRTKLLEVYAKRRDVKGFELLATQLFSLTRGEGADWQRAQELGRGIDPENPLYNAGGQPGGVADDSAFAEPLGTSTMPHSVMPAAPFRDSAMRPEPARFASAPTQDVDIDLSLDAEPATPVARSNSGVVDVDVDIDLPLGGAAPAAPPAYAMGGQVDVPLDSMLPGTTRTAPADMQARAGGGRADGGLDFDLRDISLDLETPAKPPASPARSTPAAADTNDVRPSGFVDLSGLPDDPDSQFNDDGDPMERKLDLADEFRQIGDLEGARDLLNEVIATADGPLKQKAQTMLDSLG
jgi:pilus assembly protein FimV